MSFNVLQQKIDDAATSGSLNFVSLTDQAENKITSDADLKNKGWLCNEDVYAVVSRLASLVSSLPIKLMNGDEIADVEKDEFAKFFYHNWNEKRGLSAELYRTVTNLLVYGRSYIYKKAEENAPIGFGKTELWTLNTGLITPSTEKYDYFKDPDFFIFNNGSQRMKIHTDEMIIVDNASLEDSFDSAYISPMQSVFNTVKAENNRSTAEGIMLENRGISGFVSPKATSGDAAILGFQSSVMDKIRSTFANLIGGAKKFNKVELIEQAAEFTPLGMSATELKIVEMRLNHVRSVTNAYGVPSLLFNDYQSRTHANYDSALKSMYTDAVIPTFEKWKKQFTKDYLQGYNKKNGSSYSIKLSMDEIEALNRSVSDVFMSLNPQIANRFLDNMSAEDLAALLIDLGLKK